MNQSYISVRSLFLALIVFCFAQNSFSQDTSEIIQDEAEHSNLPLAQVSNLAKAFDLIKKHYVEDIDDETLLKYAIEGMIGKLDPHSTYLDNQGLQDFTQATTGEFTGLGIEITLEKGFVKVISAIDGSPAQKVGLQSGDIILKLDNNFIKGLSLKEVSNLMRGEIGTQIELSVKRENINETMTFTITRAIISHSSVTYYPLNNQIAYTKISSFQSKTGTDYENAILDLKETLPELKAIILDLRNNPGGFLLQAVNVCDIFLEDKLVVYTQGRDQNKREDHFTSFNTIAKDLKIVVLINPGSASASEIVAGAIQDHSRGLIVGETSFGKASVQSILRLDNDSAIKLTIARYFTPNGTSIQANGIIPDIQILPSSVIVKDKKQFASESQLTGHLEEGEITNKTTNSYIDNLKILNDDYQLQQAYQLIQGALKL